MSGPHLTFIKISRSMYVTGEMSKCCTLYYPLIIFSQQIKISEMNSPLLRENLNFSQKKLGVQFAGHIVFKIACLQLSHIVVAWVCGKCDVEVWNLTSWPNMGWKFQAGIVVEIFIQFSSFHYVKFRKVSVTSWVSDKPMRDEIFSYSVHTTALHTHTQIYIYIYIYIY